MPTPPLIALLTQILSNIPAEPVNIFLLLIVPVVLKEVVPIILKGLLAEQIKNAMGVEIV